jgi:hypothetical protein
MSDAFQKELDFLGAESSPAFVRAPEGNGCAERFIRTLKENLLWVQTFDTIEDLRQALLAFRQNLQCDLADRAARLHHPRSVPAQTASTRGPRRLGFNPVSQQLRAVHSPLPSHGHGSMKPLLSRWRDAQDGSQRPSFRGSVVCLNAR